MKAVRFHAFGGPEVLRLEDVEPPRPAAGQVRVRVAASAFSAADNGNMPGLPLTAAAARLTVNLMWDVLPSRSGRSFGHSTSPLAASL